MEKSIIAIQKIHKTVHDFVDFLYYPFVVKTFVYILSLKEYGKTAYSLQNVLTQQR